MGFKNVFIYVSDALRYDYIPESIAEEGKVLPTLAPGGYTPICFSSLVTGKDPRKHSVRSFYDTLDVENVFDYFENHCYYDHPEDAMCKNVFRNYTTSKELEDMKEPFFYVERALDTHAPYGQVKHGNKIPKTKVDEESIEKRYQEGVRSTENHFWSHVEKLKELGLYEDTLVIFTSDHGEFLGEKNLFKKRTGHNFPIKPELNIIPTVFLNHKIDVERARMIDIIPTALSLIDEDKTFETDGIDITKEQPDKAYSMLLINSNPLVTTGSNWVWQDGWNQTASKIKTDLGTIIIDLVDPLRRKARRSMLADFIRPKNSKEYQSLFDRKKESNKESEELKEIDY